ncbi:Nramp family divalent metal transporter [Micrococcales bacterium 31B]|nr:Nramp family divalent metal transporter [Micrococcales bacterium 31B]
MRPTSQPDVEGAAVPKNFAAYLKGMGPGLVVALAWLGTGDLIDASVSGANFGYALLWALVIAVGARYVTVSALARYQLCNRAGDQTILDGYRRIWKGFPAILGVSTTMLGFVYNSYLLLACGTALHHLFLPIVDGGIWGVTAWSVLTMLASLWLSTRKKAYKGLEVTAKLTMAALVVCFIIALVGSGIDVPGLLRGLAFELPAGGDGVLTAAVTATALIGAVGGSAANLLYPYLMRDKGWTGPEHRKLQRYDLLTAVGVLFALVMAVWIVAAQTLAGTGFQVSGPEDLAEMMRLAVGPVGPALLWVALFFVAFDNIPAQADVFGRMFIESIYKLKPERETRMLKASATAGFPVGKHHEVDPVFRFVQLGVLTILPLVFSSPWSPNVIVLTVLGSSFSVITIPLLIIGLLYLTNSKQLMLAEYRNRWWHNVALTAIAAIGLWSTYKLIESLLGTMTGA